MKQNRVTCNIHDYGDEKFRINSEICETSGNWVLYLGAEVVVFLARDRVAELHRVIGEALGYDAFVADCKSGAASETPAMEDLRR